MEDLELKPCPFCGVGETTIQPNGRVWSGMRWSEPVSVSVRHWCAEVPGQPKRMIERVGRDEPSAIAAWNARATEAELDRLRTELANERASVHTCGPDCTRSGCVNARLRGEVEKLRAFHAWFKDHGEFLYYHFGMEVIDLFNAAALSNREGE